MTALDATQYNDWLGKAESVETTIGRETANLMNAALNRDPTFKDGDELPPAWHWLYFHEAVRGDNLGVEGHAKLGGFMPPISFGGDAPPRRMWAGGTLAFESPIRLGVQATKHSTIKSITPKEGRSGKLCFVEVLHEIRVGGVCCLRESQTIVYREPTPANAGDRDGDNKNDAPVQAKPAPTDADFSATFTPDPMLLFRYSALTFNAHRIHYDVDFCREHEGYPDLVVHGPLTATLLLDLCVRHLPNRQLTEFTYRGLSPLFNPNPFTVNGKETGAVWAANADGGLAMSATCLFL